MNFKIIILILTTFLANLIYTIDSSHLAHYDSEASSSSFGEPFFRLQPRREVIFSNTKGATIACIASGSPRPTITWFSSSSTGATSERSPFAGNELSQTRLVNNVTNLRQIIQNGAVLRLFPFKESDFRQEIHSTEYKCIASNQLATIQSTNVLVQAVMSNNQKQLQQTDEEPPPAELAKVNDEFVTLDSMAVFKCRSNGNLFATSGSGAPAGTQPASLDSFSHLLEWFTSDGLRIGPGETGKAGNKFTAFRSGELHVNKIEPADLRRTYGCRLRNKISQRDLSSSGLAQLIVTDSLDSQRNNKQPAAQAFHSVSQIIVEDASHKLGQAAAKRSLPGDSQEQSEDDLEEEEEGEAERKLLVPCAVRGLTMDGQLRWFYQPPISKHLKLISIEQFAANLNLQLLELQAANNDTYNNTAGSARSSRLSSGQQMGVSRILLGPSYLAIERPRREHSGRYVCQLVTSDSVRTMCDTNVIVRQPLRLKVEWNNQQNQQQEQSWLDYSSSLALEASEPEETPASWFSRAVDWFSIREKRHKRSHLLVSGGAPETVEVRSRGLVAPPPVLMVGQRLQLSCLATGYPVDSVKWFRDGQLINTQSSSDFQIEITNSIFQERPSGEEQQQQQQQQAGPDEARLVSALTIRQLQPKNAGLQMFECMAQNAAGDRARSSLPVFVAERQLIDWARASCPLSNSSLADSPFGNEDYAAAGSDQVESLANLDSAVNSKRAHFQQRAIFMRHNPFKMALLLESDPFELVCPVGAISSRLTGQNFRVDWRRLTIAQTENPNNKPTSSEGASRNFNQLFNAAGGPLALGSGSGGSLGAGDARFVINGSSLQIRSPSKRHDEAIYLCRQLLEEPEAQQTSSPLQATKPAGQQQIDTNRLPVHQSSLAPAVPGPPASVAACNGLLAAAMQAATITAAPSRPTSGGEQPPPAGMSSISIRIVAKPKIDPFEFSKNLEEGMRAVVVCAVVSGQSPVDITWFKDGNLLLEDEQTTLDQVNGFSSTLTFHQIRPTHSGYYTCIAANAFASTNHTSRLLVNEAAYFIEPPKNTQAILNSNVMVNCRAGGQPSPQIRWRKLVSVNGNSGLLPPSLGNRALSPAGGYKSDQFQADGLLGEANQQQMALGQQHRKLEFRIITSNSHIQILENGSMIIKEVELADASRYVCQAFNGINPSLSEMIELQVLSPAQFDVHFETVSVKRDSMIKFSCAPKGDLPMRIEWHKEGNLLAPAEPQEPNAPLSSQKQLQQQAKYTELAYLSSNLSAPEQLRQRHSNLVLRPLPAPAKNANLSSTTSEFESIKSSELFINYADRSDTGVFVCLSRNAYGKDELSYRLVVQEAPDVPLSLNAQNVLSSSLKLSWTAPFDGNLPISHFVIEHRRLTGPPTGASGLSSQHSSAEWSRLMVATNKLSSSLDQIDVVGGGLMTSGGPAAPNSNQPRQVYSIVLRQLAPKSAYHIRVAAVNGIGQSGFSAHLTVSTAEELPNSRPNDLRAQPISSSSIKVLWRGPAVIDEQAPIKGYYVSHRRLAEASFSVSGQTNKPELGWLSTSSVSVNNSTDFQPDDNPELPMGLGSPPGTTAKVRQLTGRGPINTLGGLNYELTLSNLERNNKYEFRVQPYNSMGVGPASETFGQTLKFDRPRQPQLKLIAARKQSMELKWSLPSNEQPLMGFSLFYKCEYDDWQEIQLGIIYQYVVENLRCGNKYQVYLSAFNLIGRSDPSDVLSVRTEGTVPIAPDKGQFYQANITEVILDLSSWQSGGCPISSFIIQYKRLHDSNWYILSEGSTSFAVSEKVPISNLQPASWYKLLVTASNEAGPTNAEYVFSTLDQNGEPIAPTFSMAEHEHHRSGSRTNSVLSGLHQLLSSSPNQQADKQSLLISLSCILLLLVTVVGSYFYYSRATGNPAGSSSQSSLASNSNNKNTGNNFLSGDPHKMRSPTGHLMNRMGCEQYRTSNTLGKQQHQQQLGLEESQQLLQQHLNNCAATDNHQVVVDHYVHHQPQSTMLDSFINSTFMGGTAAGQRNPTNNTANLKLLSGPGSIFGSPHQTGSSAASNSNCTNSSSLSTHSTQFMDGSSQASSAGGAKAKLQLIDESSMLPSEPLGLEDGKLQHFQLYEQRQISRQSEESPGGQNSLIYAGLRHNHVNVISENAESNFSGLIEQLPTDGSATIRQLYPSPRLLSSTSFASAADLLQRQQEIYYQQQQQQPEEPTYQRLDKFQLAGYGMQQFKAAGKSQTLRFHPNHSSCASSDAQTRTIQRFQQHQELFHQQHHDGTFTSGQQIYQHQPEFGEQCQQMEPEHHHTDLSGGCLDGNCA